MTNKIPKPPTYLKPDTQRFYERVVSDYHFEEHHVKLLESACQAWDEYQDAIAAIREHGQVFVNRHGEPRPRPEIAIARNARLNFARLMRELQLDHSDIEDARLPRLAKTTTKTA